MSSPRSDLSLNGSRKTALYKRHGYSYDSVYLGMKLHKDSKLPLCNCNVHLISYLECNIGDKAYNIIDAIML